MDDFFENVLPDLDLPGLGSHPVGKLISITVNPDSLSMEFSRGLYLQI